MSDTYSEYVRRRAPWRRAFDHARDPFTARNALGLPDVVPATIKTTPLSVAQLPPALGNGGMRAFVTDSNTVTFHATVVGGGSNAVGVICNGTVWYVG